MIALLNESGSGAENTTYGARWTETRVAERRQLAALSPSDRAAALLERYPDLKLLPGCDWEQLSIGTVVTLLCGAASEHFANIELAALAGILTTTSVSRSYMVDAERCVRHVLSLIKERYSITAPQAMTVDKWEEWGRDADQMRLLTYHISRYAAAVNYHTPA